MSADRRHDIIIVGAGVAGARLLAHLLASPWRDRAILVIERAPAARPDHLLAFWTDAPSDLDPLVEHRWTGLRLVAPDGREDVRELREHRYSATTRATLVRASSMSLEACPNVQLIPGEVDAIEDGEDCAIVRVGAVEHRGAWVFDSRRPPPGPATVRLEQRFCGWTVASDRLRLDPAVATLFDFRTASPGGACFLYLLPFAPDRALVEHVFIGPGEGPDPDLSLRTYLEAHLGLGPDDYAVVARESGSSPLSDARLPRRRGRRICAIGIRGGRLKPSSGYALTRIERDSRAIARSLARHGHPFDLPRERRLYRALDAIFLWALAREPGRAPAIFAALMRHPERTLRLLDERARLADLLLLLVVLPTLVFVRAALRWLPARRRAPPADPGPMARDGARPRAASGRARASDGADARTAPRV